MDITIVESGMMTELEQLHANAYRLHVDIAKELLGLGLDKESDLRKVEALLNQAV